MKTLIWIVGSIAAVLLLVLFASKAVVPGLFAPEGAFIDWKLIQSDTFVLQPGAILVGYPAPRSPIYGFRPKMAITAKSPVTVGFIPENYRDTMLHNPNALAKLPIVHCIQRHVLQTSFECDLNTVAEGYVAYVRDERTPGQIAGAGLLGGMGVKGPVESALVRNDIHVEYSAYTCVRGCQQQ